MMWEPEAFRRLEGQVIWVVGSGSASGLEAKVMSPQGQLLDLVVLEFQPVYGVQGRGGGGS